MLKNKKGVSPVIATVLLILVAVILFGIILWWVNSFIREDVQKNLGGGAEPIQNFCPDVAFSADVERNGKVTIQNKGVIPIYGVEVQRKGIASVTSLGEVHSQFEAIVGGDTQELEGSISGLSLNEDLLLIPILLGEIEGTQKAYPCDKSAGIEVKVI